MSVSQQRRLEPPVERGHLLSHILHMLQLVAVKRIVRIILVVAQVVVGFW